jgi:hypothetical protein
LQTRPIDYRDRPISIRGDLEPEVLVQVSYALKIVFDLV